MAKASQKMTLKVDMVAPTSVRPYYLNSKQHPPGQIKELAYSIREFGFDQPIVVDEDNVILKGHGRYLAAEYLGLEEVPVVTREGLTDPQKKAIRISDNRLFEMGSDNPENLQDEIDDLRGAIDQDLSLAAILGVDVDIEGDEKVPANKRPTTEDPSYNQSGKLINCPKCNDSFMEYPNGD